MPESKEPVNPRNDIQSGSTVGEMHARREQMADGRRYIIYYTFGEDSGESPVNSGEGAPGNV
jgi:hypothetical protein